jgi:hypothetical protein
MSAKRRDDKAPQPSGDPAPLAWLGTLEARVHAAADRLAVTTAENTRLRARVEALEAKLAARTKGDSGAASDAEGTGRGAWRREREEVRERVRRLGESLQALLAESAGSGEGVKGVEGDEAEDR